MYSTYEEHQREIETICKRTITLELSDADVKRISKKAGIHGLTVSELLQHFIGDLVDGTRTNGSDERMYAEQWLDRCGFGSVSDFTFLQYLLAHHGGVDDVIALWEDLAATNEEMANLAQSPGGADLGEIAEYREDIEYCQEELNVYWQEFAGQATKKGYEPGTLEEEMQKILEWREAYQSLLKSEAVDRPPPQGDRPVPPVASVSDRLREAGAALRDTPHGPGRDMER